MLVSDQLSCASVAIRDESGRPLTIFVTVFFSETGTGVETPVGKTKSDIRDVGNETIQSGTCR